MTECIDVIEKVARDVYKLLRPGLTEDIYHDVLCTGLHRHSMKCEREYIPIVIYECQTKRFLKPDILVNGEIIVELEACSKLNESHRYQVERYLNISRKTHAILINFGAQFEVHKCKRECDGSMKWNAGELIF